MMSDLQRVLAARRRAREGDVCVLISHSLDFYLLYCMAILSYFLPTFHLAAVAVAAACSFKASVLAVIANEFYLPAFQTDEADGDATAGSGGAAACNETNSSTLGHYRRPSQSSNPGNHNNNSTTATYATPVVSSQTSSAYGTIRKNSTPVTSNENLGTQLITRADLEAFKREILAEFRKEVKTLKSEILDGPLETFGANFIPIQYLSF
ncbi:unnamed protein product [Dibothriocephalus latus]|uniref:VASP tetramerisation domain-containing protein n=1 Tax=Dibothriocephalus latus TaxID=60516 RepID=A0A3P7MWX3_DIBLA|nr:unnamed protein product [Dibothriocephalus latus]